MAQEIVGVKIQVEGNGGEAVGSLRKQLKEAQAEVQALSDKFGASSEQAVKAAKKAAELRDRIGDAKALTDAFNPDRKFQAFASSLQGVVGGFAAVQGALGLVGVKSDEVEKTLLKVQSAMALSQGLNSVLESVDAFKNLGTVIQSTALFQKANNAATTIAIGLQRAFGVATVQTATGFKILKGAIAATGIGLLVVGLTTLIGKISEWTSSTEDNKAAQERLNRALEAQEKLFSEQKESLQRQRETSVKRAQLANATADEIFNINQQFNKKDREAAVDNYNKVLATVKSFEKEKLKVTKDGKLAGSEEDVKAYNEAKKQLESANKEIRDIDYKNQQDQLDNQININEKRKKNNQDAAQKIKQQQEKDKEERIQAQKDAGNRILELEDEIFLQSIQDETQRALVKLSQDKEKEINRINASKATAEQKAQELILIDKKYEQDKTKIETDAVTERKEKEKKDADDAANKLREKLKLEGEIRVAAIKDEFERKKAELLLQEEQEKADLEKKRTDGLVSQESYEQGLLNIKQKYVDANLELEKKQLEEKKKLQEAELEATKDLQEKKFQAVDAGLNLIGALAGKNEVIGNILYTIQKAIEIGKIISSTTSAIAQVSASTAAVPAILPPGVPNPAFPTAVAIGAKKIAGLKIGAVASIASIVASSISKFKSGAGGASVGGSQQTAAVSGGAAAPIAPQLPQATLTQLDQTSINRLGSATNRSYVLESDVTNSQERIRRINRAARLN